MESNLIKNREERNWGDLPMIQSHTKYSIKYTHLEQLQECKEGDSVFLRARVHNVRQKGNMAFLVLRQQMYTVQAIGFKSDDTPKPMIKYIGKIPNESVIDVEGVVKKLDKKSTCSINDLEIGVQKLYVISRSKSVLPFQMEDALRNENDKEEKGTVVHLKTRLDNRVLDLRVPSNIAIFKIQSGVCHFFRNYLYSEGFTEIHSAKLIGGTSEGGTEVFKTDYFGKEACLAQSPQLYKQMCIMGDFGKVFEIGPVFRAEKSYTHRHLCEYVGLDMEMEIKESYLEVLDVIGKLFSSIFKGLSENYKKEIEIVKNQYGYEEFQYLEEPLLLTFQEGVKLLNENGVKQDLYEDLNTENEKFLGKLVKEKYKTDFYILHRYPAEARPFYTMLCKDDPRVTCSYDVFMRGQEIISGAQRIHDSKILAERAIAKGIAVETIQDYIDSFELGAFPHGGFGAGLERVVMLFLGLYDCKKSSLFPRDPSRLTP